MGTPAPLRVPRGDPFTDTPRPCVDTLVHAPSRTGDTSTARPEPTTAGVAGARPVAKARLSTSAIAARERRRRRRGRRSIASTQGRGKPLPPGAPAPRHGGTRTGFLYGCRCECASGPSTTTRTNASWRSRRVRESVPTPKKEATDVRSSRLTQAVGAFAIPPHPPQSYGGEDPVRRGSGRAGHVMGDLHDAQDALSAAKQGDLRAIARRREQGTAVEDAQAKRRKVEAKIEDLRVRLKGLNIAVDEVGDRLAQAIAAHRDQWLPLLADAEADAAERFDRAVAAGTGGARRAAPGSWCRGVAGHVRPRPGTYRQQSQYAGGGCASSATPERSRVATTRRPARPSQRR